jgi:hypothetical protein
MVILWQPFTTPFMSNKTLFSLSLFVCIYFLLLITLYYFKIDAVAVGVVREILTLPMFVFFIVLLVIALTKTVKEKFNPHSLAFISCCILLALLIVGWIAA